MGLAMHFVEIISLESQLKCWHQQKKEGKDISQISFEFASSDIQKNKHI